MKLKHIVALLAVAAATGAGASYAAIPVAGETISACVDGNGRLTVIDPDADQYCGSGEQSLTWNTQGPQGPVGPQGPAGLQGLPGKDAKIDAVKVSANGTLVSSTRADISVTRPQTGTYKVVVPGGGSCRRWVDFESSPGDATTQWHAGTGAIWVDTYLHAVSFQTNQAFTLYLSC